MDLLFFQPKIKERYDFMICDILLPLLLNLKIIMIAVGLAVLFNFVTFVIFDADLIIEAKQEIEERKQRHFAKKALVSNKYMMKYIQQMVKREYHIQKTTEDNALTTEPQRSEAIECICQALFDTQKTSDIETCKTSCLDMMDDMKSIIRNLYQDSKYKKAADCTITYLSIYQVYLMSTEFETTWKNKSISLCNALFLMIRGYDDTIEDAKSVKKAVNNLQKKDISQKKSPEWYQSLQEDLGLLQKYYGKYKFNIDGMLFFESKTIKPE